MKKYVIFLMFILFLSHSASCTNNPSKSVRGCLGLGFFAEFLWVLNHLEYCQATSKIPVVYWDHSFSYFDEKGYNNSTNAWEYYFEPVSTKKYEPGDLIIKELHYGRPSIFWDYFEIIKFMHMCSPEEKKAFKQVTHEEFPVYTSYPKTSHHLYSKKLRSKVKQGIINSFIKIKPEIQKKIRSFFKDKMMGKTTIGIHLRGRHTYGEVPMVPIHEILKEANQHAGNNVQFLVATDQIQLLEQAKRELNGPVIYYPCQRFSQSTSPIPGDKLHPKLGEDVLIEAQLLAKCDFFIHTISHISTSVLYLNPSLKHTVLY